ncbi:hypothetical protein E2C01_057833 [Portunus trituberculatus]|uniref:Uncharacterized protein n=1 Tax=Portunus trituberculatus TaxID=210409 RepID=A0A5B7GU14_PORTR|nr:hypothetical protein [Portunus trituberculatus]
MRSRGRSCTVDRVTGAGVKSKVALKISFHLLAWKRAHVLLLCCTSPTPEVLPPHLLQQHLAPVVQESQVPPFLYLRLDRQGATPTFFTSAAEAGETRRIQERRWRYCATLLQFQERREAFVGAVSFLCEWSFLGVFAVVRTSCPAR